MGIIYCWTNKNTGKKYIGQTINPEQRKRNHIHEAMVRGCDYYFHRSLRKHGIDAFDYEVLEENVENLNERENYYIEKFDTIWPNGYNETFACSLSKESIEKMRETKRRQIAGKTDEGRKRMTAAAVYANTGRKRSEETKRKISETLKGRKKTK